MIQHRPKEFYEEVLRRLEALPDEKDASFEFGAFFEYIWHYIFGQPAVISSLVDIEGDMSPKQLLFVENPLLPTVAPFSLPEDSCYFHNTTFH